MAPQPSRVPVIAAQPPPTDSASQLSTAAAPRWGWITPRCDPPVSCVSAARVSSTRSGRASRITAMPQPPPMKRQLNLMPAGTAGTSNSKSMHTLRQRPFPRVSRQPAPPQPHSSTRQPLALRHARTHPVAFTVENPVNQASRRHRPRLTRDMAGLTALRATQDFDAAGTGSTLPGGQAQTNIRYLQDGYAFRRAPTSHRELPPPPPEHPGLAPTASDLNVRPARLANHTRYHHAHHNPLH